MVKHTPGPWTTGKPRGSQTHGYEVSINAKHHSGLATVVWGMVDDSLDGLNSPQQEANARLIAAAPSLLEALKEARDLLWRARLYAGYADGPLSEPAAVHIEHMAGQIIEQAEGRGPQSQETPQ